MNRGEFLRQAGAVMAVLAGLPAARAQKYPGGPIRLIVPFPPGGGTDILARIVTQAITESRGWTFVIDNKPGAGGTLGIDQLVRAAPDGLTFGVGQTANLAVAPSLYTKLPYQPAVNLAPVAAIATQPNVLVVRAESPYKSFAEFISAARSAKSSLTLGSPGTGTIGHLAGEMLARRAGFKILHVPYKGTGPALTDAISGQLDFVLTTPPGVMALLKAGKLRPLAVTSTRRLAALPSVPTVAESGFEGFVAEDWKALVAPAGTPAPMLATLNEAMNEALQNKALAAKLEAEGSAAMGGTGAELAALMKSEIDRWGEAVRVSGAKAE